MLDVPCPKIHKRISACRASGIGIKIYPYSTTLQERHIWTVHQQAEAKSVAVKGSRTVDISGRDSDLDDTVQFAHNEDSSILLPARASSPPSGCHSLRDKLEL